MYYRAVPRLVRAMMDNKNLAVGWNEEQLPHYAFRIGTKILADGSNNVKIVKNKLGLIAG